MPSSFKVGRVVSAIIILFLAGCSRHVGESGERHEASVQASGTITIDILQSGRPETYWHYEVQPSRGVVRLVSEQHFPDYRHESIPTEYAMPTGAISGCKNVPSSVSPNSVYSAACVEEQTP